ncbi:MAG: metal-dependent transcriptional regulator, partial [Bacilli bacterium]|nr:metal-dependent transcriptional regulator [Bacilli bacterium]
MHILESGEDYLESILIIKNEKGFVRSIDIVQHLGYSKPSVSIAMKKLRDNGYINIDDKGLISLTEEGNKIANTI